RPARLRGGGAVAGRKVGFPWAEALDPVSYTRPRPAAAGVPAMDVDRTGVVRPGRLARHESASFRGGLFPQRAARVLGTAFQQETKKAELELAPLRLNPASGTLVLSRRLLVRVDFIGVDAGEVSLGGSQGRRPDLSLRPAPTGTIAQLVVREKGLYKIRYEDLFGASRTALALSSLSLTHQGGPVAFHADRSSFAPGSTLYFLADAAAFASDAAEVVYELKRKVGGLRMSAAPAPAAGASTSFYLRTLELEQNKTYQAGLLDAPALWLWEVLVSPVTKTYPFTVEQLANVSASAHLTVYLQGASDFDVSPDHHVRISVNGVPLGEASWDGKEPRTIEAEMSAGVLVEGSN